jgi:hypothetical protein
MGWRGHSISPAQLYSLWDDSEAEVSNCLDIQIQVSNAIIYALFPPVFQLDVIVL